MLAEGLAPKQIWVRLIDEHSIVLRLGRIVNYAKEWHLANTIRSPRSWPKTPYTWSHADLPSQSAWSRNVPLTAGSE